MATFILTWNPNRWNWNDIERKSTEVKNGNNIQMRWSCGTTKKIKPGDKVFLFRQGKEPRGIIASGIVTVGVYEDEHFDNSKKPKKARYVEFIPDVLLVPEKDNILLKDSLNKSSRAMNYWETQSSGVELPEDLVIELENMWADFIDKNNTISNIGAGFGNRENNVKVEEAAILYVTRYYEDNGWRVKSVESEKCGYDLICVKNNNTHHVEVKGISGSACNFIITEAEFNLAENDDNFILCVICQVLTEEPRIFKFTGKEFITKFDIKPIQYRAKIVLDHGEIDT